VTRKPTAQTVPVSERALIARINRRLDARWQGKLHKVPDTSRWAQQYGPFFITDNNVITRYGLDLLKLASEFECIQPYERLED